MSAKSEYVKKWRRKCKERIVEAMGGACCICGYNRSNSALALHHLDPSKKDLALGGIRANPISWDKIVEELRKCILVCHNCHTEIHEEIICIPLNAPSFNEDFANYRLMLETKEAIARESAKTPCLLCGQLKTPNQIYCSIVCSNASKGKIDWTKINLENEIKTKSLVQIGKELGCSDNAVRKQIIKSGITLPKGPGSRVKWPFFNELLQMIEATSYTAVAKKLGCARKTVQNYVKREQKKY